MNPFDNIDYEKRYQAEVKEKWGDTEAYKEYEKRAAEQKKRSAELNEVFAHFAACMQEGHTPDSPEAQKIVEELRDQITQNYYTCTVQILAGLGQMYAIDGRFISNIDKHAPGTAQFASTAIAHYCK
jgi:hypothetical protein